MGGLGLPEVFVVALLFGLLVLPLWGALDANNRPSRQWERLGQNQTLWVTVLLAGFFLAPVGMIAAIVYFTTVRPKLSAGDYVEGNA